MAVDETGLGGPLADALIQKHGSRVTAVHFGLQSKARLATGLKYAFEDRRVRVPVDSDVRESLHSVRRKITAAQNVTYESSETRGGDHSDYFWALALAVDSADVDVGPVSWMLSGDMPASLGGRGRPDKWGNRGIW